MSPITFDPNDYNPPPEEPRLDGVLKCPRCSNSKHFIILIQLSSCGTITTIPEAFQSAEWCSWNMVQCAECWHYLVDGGKWRTGEAPRPKPSKGDILKSIPLEVLEALLRKKEGLER
jgi:hypothetical protein